MRRKVCELLFIIACVAALPACATPLTYSAKEIRGQVVDEEAGQPVEGAVVVAQWVLFHVGPGHGGHKSRLHIYETVTDKNGNYFIPEWGPKVRPPMTELHERDPEILIFKSSYEPKVLYNSAMRENSVRMSEWNGKAVKLSRTKRTLEDQAFRLSSFYGGLVRDLGNKYEWKNYPKMTLAVYREYERLKAKGLKTGIRPSLPFIETLDDIDRRFFLGGIGG